jgi:hypothetical protein
VNEVEFLDAHAAVMSPLQRAMALARAGDAKADAADQREAAERRAVAERRAETLILGNRAAGDPLGRLQRFRAEAADADDQVRDLAAKLEAATVRRDRIQGCIESLSRTVDEITAPLSRSVAPLNDPVTVAADVARTAFLEHAAYVARSRQAWQAAQSGTTRRPFVRRGGAAVRSEYCVHCTEQGVDDETSYLLHSDPELNVPVTPPGTQVEDGQREAETDRLTALGYTAETARLASEPCGAGMAVR